MRELRPEINDLRAEALNGQLRVDGLERASAHLQIAISTVATKVDAATDRLDLLEQEQAEWAGWVDQTTETEEETYLAEEEQREPILAGDGAVAAPGPGDQLTSRVDLAGSDTPPGTSPQLPARDGLASWWAQSGADVGAAVRPDAVVRQLLPGATEAAAVGLPDQTLFAIASTEAGRAHCDTTIADCHLPSHLRAPPRQAPWQQANVAGA